MEYLGLAAQKICPLRVWHKRDTAADEVSAGTCRYMIMHVPARSWRPLPYYDNLQLMSNFPGKLHV